jgi:hypothetical protein
VIDRSPRYSRALVEVLAAIAIGVVAAVFFARYSFPLELEWMEANTLRAAERLRDGAPLYSEPSDEWVSALYTPFYPWVVAFVSQFGALDYPMARMVSIAAVVATGFGLLLLVREEDKPRAHGLTAVGVWLAGYVFAFRWLDVARADALFMALTLWSLVLLRRARGDLAQLIGAGVLMALAFWTKQTAAIFVVVAGAWALLQGVRTFAAFATPIALICGLGVLWGNAQTEGWLWAYIYELHQTHAFNTERFTSKTWKMFAHGLPFLTVWVAWRLTRGLAHLVSPPDHGDEFAGPAAREGGERYWLLMALTGLVTSALGYSTQWAEPNAFIPGVTLLAAWIGVAQPQGGSAERIGSALVAGHIVCAGVIEPDYHVIKTEGLDGLLKSYRGQDRSRTVPSPEVRAQASRFVEERAHWPGPLLSPQHEWWPRTRGEAPTVSSMGINDVDKKARGTIQAALRRRLMDREFGTVWLDGSLGAGWNWLRPQLAAGYRLEERRRGPERVLPMVGFMSEAGMEVPYGGEQLRLERISPPAPAREGELLLAEFEADFRPFTIEGFGFGKAPIRSIHGKLPAAGPISGARHLSSAGSSDGIAGVGVATSEAFALPGTGGELRLLAGRVGPGEGVTISLHEVGGDDRWVAIEIPGHHFGLVPVHWRVTEAWAETRVVMVIEDKSRESAIMVDRVLLHSP